MLLFLTFFDRSQKPNKQNQWRRLPQWTVSRDSASINQLTLASSICVGTNLNSFGSLWDRRDKEVESSSIRCQAMLNRLVGTNRWLTESWENFSVSRKRRTRRVVVRGWRKAADANLSISDRIPNGRFVVRSIGREKNSNHDEQMDESLVGRSQGEEGGWGGGGRE